ncbi:hypothetical protein BsWGS_02704 [Bradybaena similaris]
MPVTRNQSNSTERPQAVASAAAEDATGAKDSSGSDETSTDTEPHGRDSPENCSICLGPFSNKSFTSSCAHSFCFICLKQWSKVKAECPLCKQSFTSIFHSIRSNDNYDIYELPPANPPHQLGYHLINYIGESLNAFASNQHYMSLPQPRLDADLTLSNFSRFQFRNRRYDRYLNPVHPVPGEHQYSFSSASFNPSSHVSAASWPTGTDAFRLQVYRYHMGPPAVILGCENSTYRLTPSMVNASAHRMQRIMPWLTRELRILLRNYQSVQLAMSIIQPLLSQVTVDSEFFSARVSPLIGQRARQFIQEFIAFTNSALSMQAFDRKAMYRRHESRIWEENTSSSSSDDDVVEITEVSPDVHISNVTASSSNTGISLQRARWDSPTPGPSWEIMDGHISVPHFESDRVSVSSESDPIFQPLLNDSDADSSEAGSDIVFVKFDKPWTERSPIKLSSDSEGNGQNKQLKKIKHKKKRRETLDTSIESLKKSKKRRSSKSRSKERVRRSISNSEDECQQVAEKSASVSLSSDKLASVSLSSDKLASVSLSSDKHASVSPSSDKHASVSLSSDKHASVSLSSDKPATVSFSSNKHASVSLSSDKSASVSLSSDKPASMSRSSDKRASMSRSSDKRASVSLSSDKRASLSLSSDKHASASVSLSTDKHASVSLSSDKRKRKKHRKSKDTNDAAQKHNESDRELVDRLFAEAIGQQNLKTFSESGDANIPSSSRSRDKSTDKSSSKERHKRKRKKKSRSSRSPSVLSSYKKHHSGHKKSSNKRESEKRKHKRKRKSKGKAASDYSSRRTTRVEKEPRVPRNQPPTNGGHSVSSTFQTSYLAGTDNVQHIPLSVWVTTWPSLPVSHTFPAPSTSTGFSSSSLPQSLPTSSGFSSHHLNYSLSERTNSAVNSQTISSGSQSSSDSDTPHPSTQVHVSDCSRTKQWLDANFSGIRQLPSVSSSVQAASYTSNSARNWSTQNTTQPDINTFVETCDVVSIASGDEDICVSSSANSTKSDSAEVTAIESCDNPVIVVPTSSHESSSEGSSAPKKVFACFTSSESMPSGRKEKRVKVYSSSSKNVSSSSKNVSSPFCSSFQPFKLPKKSMLARQNVNPIFSRMAQNSDDDDEDSDANHSVKPHSSGQEKASSIQDSLRNSSKDSNFKTTSTSSRGLENRDSPLDSTLQAIVSSKVSTPVLGQSYLSCLNSGKENASTSSSYSRASEPTFNMLPPPQAAVSPTLTSSFSNLPYSSMSGFTPLPSILSQTLPFVIPQAPLPVASSSLHFPYPSTSPTIFPAAYASSSQGADGVAASSNHLFRKCTNSSHQLLSADKFAVDIENNDDILGKEAGDATNTSTSACQQSCAPLLNYNGCAWK